MISFRELSAFLNRMREAPVKMSLMDILIKAFLISFLVLFELFLVGFLFADRHDSALAHAWAAREQNPTAETERAWQTAQAQHRRVGLIENSVVGALLVINGAAILSHWPKGVPTKSE